MTEVVVQGFIAAGLSSNAMCFIILRTLSGEARWYVADESFLRVVHLLLCIPFALTMTFLLAITLGDDD